MWAEEDFTGVAEAADSTEAASVAVADIMPAAASAGAASGERGHLAVPLGAWVDWDLDRSGDPRSEGQWAAHDRSQVRCPAGALAQRGQAGG